MKKILSSHVPSNYLPGVHMVAASAGEVVACIIRVPMEIVKQRRQAQISDSSIKVSSLCGAIAGGFSATLTTPLDVAKTRIMLAHHDSTAAKGNINTVLRIVYKQQGLSGLFAGVVPRTLWITVGGAVFFGVYEKAN
ncbi:S-adenosylmethionine mitochondrial carrier protein-like [Portunus trituberculatus]|uniref:S-adenosylmethionine mitochondrial carrier protein-like n=1 Tax=Portunus trituberculatus TaxID=210409 RepID=UPI001E1D024D|nr:S-adenosylmethionine mitochondrial carrier protein-like [Portunus trituberculatus]